METTSPDGRRQPRTVSVPEFRIFEAINEANRKFRTQRYEWATLCLVIDASNSPARPPPRTCGWSETGE